MLMPLDAATLQVVVGGLYVLMPLSIWWALGRPQQVAPRLWCAGAVIGGLGLGLIGLRGQIPESQGIVLGAWLLALGVLLIVQSLRLDLGRPWPRTGLLTAALAYAAALLLGLVWLHQPGYAVLVLTVNLLVILVLIHSAWQVYRQDNSRNALTMALVLLPLTLVIGHDLLRALQLATQDLSAQTVPVGPVSLTVTLLDLAVALVFNMGYLGLALERLERQRLQALQQQARQHVWQAQHEALAAFDRERLMSVLADSLRHTLTQPLTSASLRLQIARRCLAMTHPDAVLLQQLMALMGSDLQRVGETIERIRKWLRPGRAQSATIDLGPLVQEVEQLLAQEARQRGVRVSWHCPSTAVPVQGDGLQLAQALVQIVRNALQAATGQPEPAVQVGLSVETGVVCLQVRDNGPGLPQSLLDAMAQPQGHVPDSLQALGLFIVQGIVRQHQGTLELRNTAGRGARVSIRLPLAGGLR